METPNSCLMLSWRASLSIMTFVLKLAIVSFTLSQIAHFPYIGHCVICAESSWEVLARKSQIEGAGYACNHGTNIHL